MGTLDAYLFFCEEKKIKHLKHWAFTLCHYCVLSRRLQKYPNTSVLVSISCQSLPLCKEHHLWWFIYLFGIYLVPVPTEAWEGHPELAAAALCRIPPMGSRHLCSWNTIFAQFWASFCSKQPKNRFFVVKAKVPWEKLRAWCQHSVTPEISKASVMCQRLLS